MDSLRIHGLPPYRVALIHGGPGGAGQMAPVARVLAGEMGVLEPHQTARSVLGQVEELAAQLQSAGTPPYRLAGHSWGAWLAFIFTAMHPGLVEKLVLISAGAFDAAYAGHLLRTRQRRLHQHERELMTRIEQTLAARERPPAWAWQRLLELSVKADSYDCLPEPPESIPPQWDIFLPVWQEAAALRQSGELLAYADLIDVPVVAIHGEDDPHPLAGVQGPLAQVLARFEMRRLPRCGHYPWKERHARTSFFQHLREALEPG